MRHTAKKSLGQNFLKSQKAISDMVNAGHIVKTDTVLEIGPGTGMLTRALLKTGAHIIAVEKDTALIPILENTFPDEIKSGQLTLIVGDILDLNLKKIGLKNNAYTVIANIPYYITGILLRILLEGPIQPETIVFMVQKEVALRIVARDHKESILSLSVKYFGNPIYIETVSKRYFKPEPRVDSAIIGIYDIGKKKTAINSKTFFEVIKLAFGHKRKTLAHNLSKKYSSEKITRALALIGKDSRIRAEDLSYTDWEKYIGLFT